MRNNLLKLNRRYLTATLLAIISTGLQAQQTAKPRLVISIAINRMTSASLEEYCEYLEKDGLRQLIETGKVYSSATMPFAPADIASAIATIYTGTTPYYNGIANAQWLDRSSLRKVSCVDDGKYRGIGSEEGGSASNVLSSMIGDELKARSENRGMVYSIASNREAAILSACHYADCAFWVNDKTKNWSTSTYYSAGLPDWLPDIDKNEKNATSSDNNYLVTNAAISCIANYSLGKDDDSDILALTFEVTDKLDSYKKLDQNISRLVKIAKSAVGEENLLVVTFGTGLYPEQHIDYGLLRIPNGKYYINRSAKLLELYLNAIYGQGKYVDGYLNNHIYINTKLAEQKRIDLGELLNRSQTFLLESSGVSDVFTRYSLQTAASDMLRTMRNSFNSATGGDLIILTQPGWTLVNEETKQELETHATSAIFPIIIWGAGTEAKRIDTPVSAEQISPTISKAIRIRAPNACTALPLR